MPVLPRRPADPEALAECAEEILAKLAGAKSAAIIVDVEIRRYGLEDRVAALARKLGLPVVTTFMGRGLLDGAPDVLSGTYLGAAGDPAVTDLVERADVLLLLGVILSDTNFALSHRRLDPRGTVLAIDRTVRVGHHVYPNVPIDDLVDALLARARPIRSRRQAPSARDRLCARDAGGRCADRALRHRLRHQRPVRPPRRPADDLGHRRLPVHRHGDREQRARRARDTTPAWGSACRPASAWRRRPAAARSCWSATARSR